MVELKNKSAMVCGASQGIGRACAIELARGGASVTILARNEDRLRAVVASLDTTVGQKHHYLVVDYTQPTVLSSLVQAHIESIGPMHILVNNTGGPPAGPVLDADIESLAKAFSNHLLCNQLLTQLVVPGMKAANFGRVINIISTSVITPIRGLGVSNTIRGAVANWAKTLAGELGSCGITVNSVLPGFTETDRLHAIFKNKAAKTGQDIKDVESQALGTIPAGRLGKPEEIASVVGFLASPAAAYINGVNLPVDGGRTAVQ